MKNAVLSLVFSAFLLIPALARADSYNTFYITNGTLASGGTFSGSFVLDTSNDDIQSASILVDADGIDQTLTSGNNSGFAQYFQLPDPPDYFYLLLTSSVTSPELGSPYGIQTALVVDDGQATDLATGGDISATPPSATPEPSSLWLLGTGSVGLVGVMRRRLLGRSGRA